MKKQPFHIFLFVLVSACLLLQGACRRKQPMEKVDAVTDRSAMPALSADTVTTLISDSGIVRYRIVTPKWEIYDKASPAYWEFPQGVYLEKFSPDLSADAFLEADYAHYNETDKIWLLHGHVKALNLEGEQFETEELLWDENAEKVWSDSLIKITREKSIITGIGFDSNQEMTRYTIRKPQGVFPIEDE